MAFTKTKAQKDLEAKGYKITFAASGNSVTATKGTRTYSASSMTALKKKILS